VNTAPTRAIKKFYSYAPADKELRNELERHLEALRHPGRIIGWHDGVILAGTDRKREINKQLYKSDIILLLISHNFIASVIII
jgi:TIR domain